jgi:hypothetical protein
MPENSRMREMQRIFARFPRTMSRASPPEHSGSRAPTSRPASPGGTCERAQALKDAGWKSGGTFTPSAADAWAAFKHRARMAAATRKSCATSCCSTVGTKIQARAPLRLAIRANRNCRKVRTHTITLVGLTPDVWHKARSEANHEQRAALICLLTAGLAAQGVATIVGQDTGGWFWLPPLSLWQPWARAGLDSGVRTMASKGQMIEIRCES